jgi:hypothetical protein
MAAGQHGQLVLLHALRQEHALTLHHLAGGQHVLVNLHNPALVETAYACLTALENRAAMMAAAAIAEAVQILAKAVMFIRKPALLEHVYKILYNKYALMDAAAEHAKHNAQAAHNATMEMYARIIAVLEIYASIQTMQHHAEL